MRRRAPAVAWSARLAIDWRARDSCPRTSTSCWRRAISTRRAAASQELTETAASLNTEVLAAIAAHAGGSVHLAEWQPARGSRSRAARIWNLAADRGAVSRGTPARAAGAGLRRCGRRRGRAARTGVRDEVFERLGARPDLAAIEAIMRRSRRHRRERKAWRGSRLTERELQVLRLIARRQDQQGDRTRAVVEREDDRSPRQQHLRQGGCFVARGGHGIRLRAQADLGAPGRGAKLPMPLPA